MKTQEATDEVDVSRFPVMSSDEIQELKSVAIKLYDFKMDVIKWQLNLGSCNFSLTSYL